MKSLSLLLVAAACLSFDFHLSVCKHVEAATLLSINSVLGDNMVLQRNSNAAIWGTSVPNSSVRLVLDGVDNYTTLVSASGDWQINLRPYPASVNHQLIISDDNNDQITINNVDFGDVYLCSGQSNMEFTVNAQFDAAQYIEEANELTHLRFFSVARKASLTPLTSVTSRDLNNPTAWSVPNNVTVGGQASGDGWSYPSALCYLSMRQIYINLKGEVPVGFIGSYYGGTFIRAWSDVAPLVKCENVGAETEPSTEAAARDDLVGYPSSSLNDTNGEWMRIGDDPDPNWNSTLWNGMIHPLLPFRFKGVLWYQGEANSPQPTNYACAFPAMIQDWRLQFQAQLPFWFVQLAAYSDNTFPALRDAQLAALTLPDTGFITAIDLGDPNSPYGSIHPRSKPELALRMWLVISAMMYGGLAVSSGPRLFKIEQATFINTLLVHFVNDASSAGLVLNGTAFCTSCCDATSTPFVIVFSDKSTQRPTISIANELVKLTYTPTSATPLTLQLEYEAYPQCALYNSAGLPASPFSVAL